jgi:hypothetical protein
MPVMTGPRANSASAMDVGVRRAAMASARVRAVAVPAVATVRKTADRAMTAPPEDHAAMAIVDPAPARQATVDPAVIMVAMAAAMTAWNVASRRSRCRT